MRIAERGLPAVLATTALVVTACSGSSLKGVAAQGAAGSNRPASSSPAAKSADWCTGFWKASNGVSDLYEKAFQAAGNFDQEPHLAEWRAGEAAEVGVIPSVPKSSYEYDRLVAGVRQVVDDVDDITAHGFDNSNGGANLQYDLGISEGLVEATHCYPAGAAPITSVPS